MNSSNRKYNRAKLLDEADAMMHFADEMISTLKVLKENSTNHLEKAFWEGMYQEMEPRIKGAITAREILQEQINNFQKADREES